MYLLFCNEYKISPLDVKTEIRAVFNMIERTNKMSKRLKRPLPKMQIVKRVLALSFCILLPISIFLGYSEIKDFYEEKIKVISQEMAGYTVTVYEASADIRAGEIITKKMVKLKTTLSGQKQSSFIKAEDIGGQALVDIPKGTQVLKNMTQNTTIEDGQRELEFSLNIAGENIKKGDYTDIRLRYPDGEDYIVLSKSYISRIDWEKGYLYMNLLPEEIHLISSALVDCYLNSGSYLYTTRYIVASYQNPSSVTYTPNQNVLKLIEKDPNVIVKAREYLNDLDRRSLEERLRNYYSQYGSSQSETYAESDGIIDNSNSSPLYYITGKAGDSKQKSTEESDKVTDTSEETKGQESSEVSTQYTIPLDDEASAGISKDTIEEGYNFNQDRASYEQDQEVEYAE
jgi:hypothetical protein